MAKQRPPHRLRNALVGVLGPPLVRAWLGSMRVRLEGFCLDGRIPLPAGSGIHVLWHQRLFTPAGFFRKSGFRVIVSQHSDGEMIARIIQGLGMDPVRGSSTRGGAKAVLELLRARADRERFFIIITADGPKGPPRRFQTGAIYLASKTGLPIWANAVSVKSAWKMPSWDTFLLPKPFTRAIIRRAGEPVFVPPDLDREGLEHHRLRMERVLEDLTRETDDGFEEFWARALSPRRLPPFEPVRAQYAPG